MGRTSVLISTLALFLLLLFVRPYIKYPFELTAIICIIGAVFYKKDWAKIIVAATILCFGNQVIYEPIAKRLDKWAEELNAKNDPLHKFR